MPSTNFTVRNSNNAFDLSLDDLAIADIVQLSENKFHIIKNNNSYIIDIQSIDLKNNIVEGIINDRHFKYTIENELQKKIQSMGLASGSKKKDDKIVAPMPGLVLRILVQEGQQVQKGEALIVLEAMKMENVIKAAHDGIVKTIHVQQSDKVDKAQTLISF